METTRLMLRRFNIEDTRKCFENFGNDESIGKYIPIFPLKSIDDMAKLINNFSQNPNIYLIIEKITNEPVGYITIDIPYESLKVCEIGYVIGEKYQHRGYAKEALNKCLEYLFIQCKLHLVEAKVNDTNIASINLLEKIGFIKEAVLRDRRIDFNSGERNNLIIYSAIKSDVG